MKTHLIEISLKIELTDENINDLMVCALEGGINYWVISANAKFVPDNVEYEYLSELISKGGVIELHDSELNETYDLNLSKFMNGVKLTCEHFKYCNAEELMEFHDATTADCIIQYGLFSEIVYG